MRRRLHEPEPLQFVISIHAPLTGCDILRQKKTTRYGYFNPRTPYGMRQLTMPKSIILEDFNPRTPYGMRPGHRRHRSITDDFNPRTPYGMRH